MKKSRKHLSLRNKNKRRNFKYHSKGKIDVAFKFKKELHENATSNERKLISLLANNPLCKSLKFQHIIYIKRGNKTEKFYIAKLD